MAFTSQDDTNILQASDNAVVGAGAGDDTYILSAASLSANQVLTISDPNGNNKLQLVDGLEITSSQVAENVAVLTLSNAAEITILSADTFDYLIGGDPLTGAGAVEQTYASFVTQSLDLASLPTGAEVLSGGAVTIGDPSSGGTLVVPANQTVSGSSGPDRFLFDVETPLAAGERTESQIQGFDVSQDTLVLDLEQTDESIDNLSELDAFAGSLTFHDYDDGLVSVGLSINFYGGTGDNLATLMLLGIDTIEDVAIELI